jgi:hypothetical protein
MQHLFVRHIFQVHPGDHVGGVQCVFDGVDGVHEILPIQHGLKVCHCSHNCEFASPTPDPTGQQVPFALFTAVCHNQGLGDMKTHEAGNTLSMFSGWPVRLAMNPSWQTMLFDQCLNQRKN